MFEASYGMPPDDPDEIVWVTLAEHIKLQGTPDPKKWTVQPHCPHCKTVLRGYDKKAALGTNEKEENLGFYLYSQDIVDPKHVPQRRPVVGFAHRPKEAKADCPYSYANDPAYKPQENRGTSGLEEQRNIAKLSHPVTAEALQEILRYLMAYLTHESKISEVHQKILGEIAKTYSYIKGLATHAWAMPIVQVLFFGAYERPEPKEKVVQPEVQQHFFQAASALVKRERKKPVLTVMWRPLAKKVLKYVSVHGENRKMRAVSRIGLFSVHEKKIGRSYRQLRYTGTDMPIVIDVSREWALGIVNEYRERKVRKEGQEKALNRHGKRLRPRRKRDLRQLEIG